MLLFGEFEQEITRKPVFISSDPSLMFCPSLEVSASDLER
jgi:hypothetical protein